MKKVELLKKLKSLEKTMQDTEKAINDLSVHIYPYLGKNMFEVDKQWIERVHNCMYKTKEDSLIIKLVKLEFKFFNLLLEDEDYEEFDLIEEKINNQ